MPHPSVHNKILLLLYGSIVLVLILVASIFSLQMTQLYKDTARAELSDSAGLLYEELRENAEDLVENGQRLAASDDVRAALNLIERYQDSANYQALIFDPEKRKLAEILRELVHTVDLNLASFYQTDGTLIAFYCATANVDGGVYQSFSANGPTLMPLQQSHGSDQAIKFYSRFGTIDSSLTQQPSQVVFRHGQDATSVLLEVNVPVMLDSGAGGQAPLGWIRLAYLLDKPYVDKLALHLGVNVALVSEQGTIASNDFVPMAWSSHEHDDARLLRLGDDGAPNILWFTNKDGIEAHLELPLAAGGNAHLVLGEGNSELAENLKVFGRSVFWVLLLSGVLVMPIGYYLANRWVTHPIGMLTRVAQDITMGGRPQLSDVHRNDELGVLADAFVVMSGAIMARENELRDKQRQLEGIIGNAPAIIYMKDTDGRYLMVNNRFEHLMSLSNEEVRGKTDGELFGREVAEQVYANDMMVLERKEPVQVEEVISLGGELYTYLSVKFPLLDDDRRVVAICGISTDITKRKRAESDLLLAKNIIQNANEAVVVTDLNGVISEINNAYEHITGYSRDEVIGKTPAINKSGHHDKQFYEKMWGSIHEKGYWQGEIWDRRKDGEVYPKWLSINTVRDELGQPTHYVGIFSDISSQKATEEQLERLAYYDSLTDLPNRLLFRDRLNQEIAMARRHKSKIALLYIDLDRFKYVNDTLGHAAGDELLSDVGRRLKGLVRESDTVSRLGGDEFTVIIPDVEHEEQISAVAQKIVDEMADKVRLQGQEIYIGASVGVAIYPDDGDEFDTLNRHADMALYKAKDEGRNNFQFYSAEMQTLISERIALEEDLRKGLQRGEFVLHYQPKYDVASGEITGMESLVRWQHPERGMVSPVEFIPLAEETGLIIPLSEMLLHQACQQTAQWNEKTGSSLKVAVNLSAKQFQQQDLALMIKRMLDETKLPAEYLELELTESMVMGDVEGATQTMASLRELGLSLAIDDFGTGYSSLSYLKKFPITTLKIDQSFVRDLSIDSDDASIVQAIIAMGKQLDLHVVAEGVETEEQLEFLRHHGCGEVQGYLLSRPLPEQEFARLLQAS